MANQTKYTIFHPFIWSFFSKQLYVDVARNWRGCAFFYLFILLAICWIPIVYQYNQGITAFMQNVVPQMTKNFPTVTVNAGELSIDKPMPFVIMDDKNKPVLVVDTTGQINSLDQEGVEGLDDVKVLITKTQVFARSKEHEIRQYTIPKDTDFSFSPEDINKWGNTLNYWLILGLFPFLLVFSYLYRIIQTLLYAAVGTLILNKFVKTDLEYQAILRLSVVAITPAVVISTILGYFFIAFPYELVLYFLLSMIYLIFGLHANKSSALQED